MSFPRGGGADRLRKQGEANIEGYLRAFQLPQLNRQQRRARERELKKHDMKKIRKEQG